MTTCWVPGADESPYNIHNLPFGVFSTADETLPRIGVRIGDQILDMYKAVLSGDCQTCATCAALRDPALNRLLSLGKEAWRQVRAQAQEALTESSIQEVATNWLTPVSEAIMHAPLLVTDYVDFTMRAPHSDRYFPRASNGRASTLLPSGMELVRPSGYRRGDDGLPVFGPTRALDIEAEVGFLIGGESEIGRPVSPDAFEDYVFGAVLLNDWTARDFAELETDGLGPVASKSFATSMSAWVTPIEALNASRTAAPEPNADMASYLKESDRYGFDLRLNIEVNGVAVAGANFAESHWTPAQQLAQLTASGAILRPGLLYGSGEAATGQFRLENGDIVKVTATAPGPRGTTIALGEVETRVLPSIT
ncbi:fumarylacetoacetate hydrolase family protein [Glycomyces sp. TRM65418]|uniref:fumarylacetoacetate hydrolase family protein n=1 Tax=Glycomyces sp. TRM65418 TaxID=2867006 RepID=UPI001CE63529|nr:fumarylacetoacetate hydrolase family protein [Glycomyces sp. TRM65418]MCC3764567.1 fumarylacetoacetate hydrolase family protein [Glycomyces sp. TRM65418]QZD54233.1 fumarylacetoacetate hydrolase family protein [Glycomyces sp. TRM65418]